MQFLVSLLSLSGVSFAVYNNGTSFAGQAAPTIAAAPTQIAAAAPASSDQLTTYVTVKLGKTLTITTPKSQATGITLVNGAPAAGAGSQLVALGAALGAVALL